MTASLLEVEIPFTTTCSGKQSVKELHVVWWAVVDLNH
jgi:hypothetical protein